MTASFRMAQELNDDDTVSRPPSVTCSGRKEASQDEPGLAKEKTPMRQKGGAGRSDYEPAGLDCRRTQGALSLQGQGPSGREPGDTAKGVDYGSSPWRRANGGFHQEVDHLL